jgi:hypothetical protein
MGLLYERSVRVGTHKSHSVLDGASIDSVEALKNLACVPEKEGIRHVHRSLAQLRSSSIDRVPRSIID